MLLRAMLAVALCASAVGPAAPCRAQSAPARRVVSLNPSLTAILLALGARDQIVGVDEFSARDQPTVAGLPTVGGLYHPSLEAVSSLSPDLVVLVPSAEQRGFRARLQQLGLRVLELDPLSFEDVLETIERLGSRVGRAPEARRRVEEIRSVRRAVEQAAGRLPRSPGVLVIQRDPLYVVGRGSFIDEMLRAVGLENLGAAFDEPYPRVSREWLIGARPQTLLDSARDGAAAEAYWARWPSLPAVQRGRVVALPEGVTTLPGPYLDRALLLLAEAVHGRAAFARVLELERPR